MNQPTLLFDFDGTLADTMDTTFDIYNRIAPDYRCLAAKHEDIEMLRGTRPQEFLHRYKVRWWKLPFMVRRMRKELKHQIRSIHPFERLGEELQILHNTGFQLGVVSSNSRENIQSFFKRHEWPWFDFIEESHHAFRKHTLLKRILKKYNLNSDSVIFIGDETRDIEAAHRVKIRAVAVGWGFHNAEVLKKAKPEALIEQPQDLSRIIQHMPVWDNHPSITV